VPDVPDSNSYVNNYAPYGSTMGSYPADLVIPTGPGIEKVGWEFRGLLSIIPGFRLKLAFQINDADDRPYSDEKYAVSSVVILPTLIKG
jgi:hypothetical protein